MNDLREKIARAMCKTADDDWSLGRNFWLDRSDAVLALVRAELTSDAAVERAKAELYGPRWTFDANLRAAILAALGEEPSDD